MTSQFSRRDFLKFLGISSPLALMPLKLFGADKPHIVIVGGGFAGATCAKYLKLWGADTLDVTLIDKNESYYSPILSNLVLNGQKVLNDLKFTYSNLQSKYGVNFVNKEVSTINSNTKTIVFSDNSTQNYDKLVLAPGIDFIQSNTYDFTKVPHAWQGGEQITLLKQKIDAIPNNGSFIMSIPASPYRCPPGPYERACVIADYVASKNISVTVLDENSDVIVERDIFRTKFSEYGINYIPNARVTNVNDSTNQVTYNNTTTLSANLLNIIPNQKASSLIFNAGLNDGNFASVNMLTYESSIKTDIFVIGDSHKSAQPKAGHIGNSEAKVCADAILRNLVNELPYATPVTNSACYSPVSSTQASWLSAVYKYDETSKAMVLSDSRYPLSGTPSVKNYQDMFSWSGNLFSDTFL